MAPYNVPSFKAPPPYFSHAVKVGATVYVSGNTGVDPVEGTYVAGTVGDRTTQAMKNIEAVLKEGGLDLTNIVNVTIFLSKYTEDFQTMNKAYVAAFPEGHAMPARACVGVAALPGDTDVEIQVIAAAKE